MIHLRNALLLVLLSIFFFPDAFAPPPRARKTLQFQSSGEPVRKKKPIHFEPTVPFRKKQELARAANQKTPSQLAQQPPKAQKPVAPKKRILVFSCKGGGGHTSASNALVSYLFDEYEIKVDNIFEDVLHPVDTLGTLTFGKMNGVDFYNFCLRSGWNNLVGSMATIGETYYGNWRASAIEQILLDYFSAAKPDLIISVIQFVNGSILKVAEKLNIPFLIIPTDADTSNFITGICKPTYRKFRYSLPCEDQEVRAKIKPAEIPPHMVTVSGYPLRPEFFKPKDVAALKKEFNVPSDKPVVMVFMGGTGSLASYRYVRVLSRLGFPLHMIVVLGRNERLKRNINKIMLPEGVSMTLLGFTPRIADLMALSDVLITKSGGGSTFEGLESCVPMIFDQTSGTIRWEAMNVTFSVKNGLAEVITQFSDLEKILPKYLKKDDYRVSIKKKMKKFPRERFNEKIKALVEEMFTL